MIATGPRVAILLALAASAVALAVAPAAVPDSYDWMRHTTSESAAQGVEGAWVARLGFLLFGFGALAEAVVLARRWGPAGATLLGAFGALMLATAAFSHRPFDHAAPYDRTEDTLHSINATAMGFAFAVGVVAVSLRRAPAGVVARTLDAIAVGASVALPLAMAATEAPAGLLQRAMFAIAYAWFAFEALRPAVERGGDSG